MGAPHPARPIPGYANSDEKTWALIAHFGGHHRRLHRPAGGAAREGERLAHRAGTRRRGAQLPDHLECGRSWARSSRSARPSSPPAHCSSCCCWPWAVIVIFSVIAGLKANEGQLYHYPATVRLVKYAVDVRGPRS